MKSQAYYVISCYETWNSKPSHISLSKNNKTIPWDITHDLPKIENQTKHIIIIIQRSEPPQQAAQLACTLAQDQKIPGLSLGIGKWVGHPGFPWPCTERLAGSCFMKCLIFLFMSFASVSIWQRQHESQFTKAQKPWLEARYAHF